MAPKDTQRRFMRREGRERCGVEPTAPSMRAPNKPTVRPRGAKRFPWVVAGAALLWLACSSTPVSGDAGADGGTSAEGGGVDGGGTDSRGPDVGGGDAGHGGCAQPFSGSCNSRFANTQCYDYYGTPPSILSKDKELCDRGPDIWSFTQPCPHGSGGCKGEIEGRCLIQWVLQPNVNVKALCDTMGVPYVAP